MHRFAHARITLPLLALTLLLTITVTTSAQSSGTIYYVATTGNNANPGTESQPFLTLAKGVSVLKPGDTLMVRDGLYQEELANTIPSGVSWQQPITLKAYPGERVIIQPKAGAERVITISGDKHHIIIDGFIIDGTYVSRDGIKIAGIMDTSKPNPTYIRIINNEVRNVGATKSATNGYTSYGHGILTTGLSNYIEYINNRIHDNGLTDFDHGIYHTSSYSVIENNVVYNNKGTGIKIGWGQNALDNIVRNNVVYDNNLAVGANGQKKQGRGIGVYSGSGTLIYNNVIWGAHATGIDVTYGGNDAKVFNNTIIATSGYGIAVGIGSDPAETATNAVIKNNLVVQESTYPAIYNSRGLNVIFENNLTFGSNPSIRVLNASNTTVSNNLEDENPGFVDMNAKNFSLLSTSPAIDKGAVISEVSFDFLHVPRPQGSSYDIGAFEFVGQVVSQEPTPTPAPIVYTDPTVYLTTTATDTQVSVVVNVANSANLFGMEAYCTTNPAVLVGVDSTDGTIFTNAKGIFVNQPYNQADGTWRVAASLTRPEVPFSGDGVAFSMNYQIQSVAASPITCAVIAVDQGGVVLPFDVVNTIFQPANTGSQGDTTLEPPPEIPGLDEEPIPTNEPTPTATSVPPTATPPAPTPTAAADLGTIAGVAARQTVADDMGITVELLVNDEVVAETLTDANGSFSFANLALGSYVVKVSAPGHLPVARNVTLDTPEQTVALERMTLVAGDIDDNAIIDLSDAGMIGANYGVDGSLVPQADLNQDNTINIADLAVVGGNFGLSGVILLP